MNTMSHAVSAEQYDDIPQSVKVQKITNKISEILHRIQEQKRETTLIYNEVKQLEKMFQKYAVKLTKQSPKSSQKVFKRKPSGFASPSPVSPELCRFMGRDVGVLISRTETSKFISEYVKTNQLYDPDHKNIIRPDDSLAALLGEESKHNEITFFSIQKYINRHFLNPSTLGRSSSNFSLQSTEDSDAEHVQMGFSNQLS